MSKKIIKSASDAVDEEFHKVERRLKRMYDKQAKELEEKASSFFSQFKRDDELKKKLVDEGKLSKKEYQAWRRGKMMTGKKWESLQKQCNKAMLSTSKAAMDIVNGKVPEIYCLAYNHVGTKAGELVLGYSFDLVNAHAVMKMAREGKTVLPYKWINGRKYVRWNTKKINSEVLQGILNGESVDELARRFRGVSEMDRVSSIRNARTAFTSAENGGTFDAMGKLQDDGLMVEKAWVTAHFGNVRKSHAAFEDMGPIKVEEEFDNGLMYPGDPDGAPEEVYNCRCTLETIVVGYNGVRF